MGFTRHSAYMRWLKTRGSARYDLASSGVAPCSLPTAAGETFGIGLAARDAYGFAPLIERIASRYGVSADCVVPACGASMANHLLMASLLRPGDEALIEHPTYPLLIDVAKYFGAEMKMFRRIGDCGRGVDLEEIERLTGAGTRLIILTNLHNPSSELLDETALRRIAETARRVSATVVVDEVYLEALFERRPRSAFHLDEVFAVTSSLTKAYGLGWLRCGWILARPPLARQLRRLNDLFGVDLPEPAERLSCTAFDALDKISKRAAGFIESNRRDWNSFLVSRADLSGPSHIHGTTVFPRLTCGAVAKLCSLLRKKFETTIVPGWFFGAADRFRVGLGCEPATFREGLNRLGCALNELALTCQATRFPPA